MSCSCWGTRSVLQVLQADAASVSKVSSSQSATLAIFALQEEVELWVSVGTRAFQTTVQPSDLANDDSEWKHRVQTVFFNSQNDLECTFLQEDSLLHIVVRQQLDSGIVRRLYKNSLSSKPVEDYQQRWIQAWKDTQTALETSQRQLTLAIQERDDWNETATKLQQLQQSQDDEQLYNFLELYNRYCRHNATTRPVDSTPPSTPPPPRQSSVAEPRRRRRQASTEPPPQPKQEPFSPDLVDRLAAGPKQNPKPRASNVKQESVPEEMVATRNDDEGTTQSRTTIPKTDDSAHSNKDPPLKTDDSSNAPPLNDIKTKPPSSSETTKNPNLPNPRKKRRRRRRHQDSSSDEDDVDDLLDMLGKKSPSKRQRV